MEDLIKKVEEIIEKDGLKQRCRYRRYLDKRSYLYAMLRKSGCSLVEIANLFDLTHATIINGIKNHYYFMDSKNEYYLINTKEYEKEFSAPADNTVNLIEKDEYKYNGTQLIEDILNCNNTTMLGEIKRRIRENEYLFTKATLTE